VARCQLGGASRACGFGGVVQRGRLQCVCNAGNVHRDPRRVPANNAAAAL
jgi:hypothetical protein